MSQSFILEKHERNGNYYIITALPNGTTVEHKVNWYAYKRAKTGERIRFNGVYGIHSNNELKEAILDDRIELLRGYYNKFILKELREYAKSIGMPELYQTDVRKPALYVAINHYVTMKKIKDKERRSRP